MMRCGDLIMNTIIIEKIKEYTAPNFLFIFPLHINRKIIQKDKRYKMSVPINAPKANANTLTTISSQNIF